jgi:hypothetical protein
LRFSDRSRIARKQRLDIEGLFRLDDEMHLIARNVDAGQPVDDLSHLRHDDAALEGRRLNDRRRVFGVGAGIEITVPIRADRCDQRNVRRQIDEVAGKQF